jgi:hypothetical protein
MLRVMMIMAMLVLCISIPSALIGLYSLSNLTIIGSDNLFGFSIDVVKNRVRMAMVILLVLMIASAV